MSVDFEFEFYTQKNIDKNKIGDILNLIIKKYGGELLPTGYINAKEYPIEEVMESKEKSKTFSMLIPFFWDDRTNKVDVTFTFEKNQKHNKIMLSISGQIPFYKSNVDRINKKEFFELNSVKNELKIIDILEDLYYKIEPVLGIGDTDVFFSEMREKNKEPIRWIDKLEIIAVPRYIFFGPNYVKKYDLYSKLTSNFYAKYKKLEDGGLMLVLFFIADNQASDAKFILALKELHSLFNITEIRYLQERNLGST